ncbi:MAG: methyltransferase [Proteobacteria bacterium]|nr:methyltransferase [Pseudomonadota bacterium]
MRDRPGRGSGGWRGWRDRLLADPRFQRWAARFPLTRPIARRSARELFDVCAGFVYAQVLFACVRLRLFDLLFEGPMTLPAVATRLSMDEAAAARLLAAAASLRLVERRGPDHWGLGMLGAAAVGNPGIAAMVEHHALLYADLQDPVALLRGELPHTAVRRFWPYAGAGTGVAPEDAAKYSRLMAVSQAMLAEDIVDAYPLARHRCLLDVGGGDGTFLTTVANRLPGLRLRLFDLPAVAAQANRRFAERGLADRAEAIGGDFRQEPLPAGADVISLVRVLHDHDDDQAALLLRRAHAALPPGGTLLVAEPMIDERRPDPVGDAYFGFYLLAMGNGRARRPSEIRCMMVEAGFGQVRERRTCQPMLTRLMVGNVSESGRQGV